ncbi:tetratricopeptide repeat protein [Novipirellula maiorica]|nr:tetratricopeptide repeat protein [Rhodopirellula maiorica]
MKYFNAALMSAVWIGWVLLGNTVQAQNDRIYPSSGSPVIGSVAETSPQGIQVKVGGNTQNFVAGEIEKILFAGDSPALTKGREFALDGQYDQAMQELKTVNIGELPRDVIKADAMFYTAYSMSQLAIAGKGNKQAAKQAMLAFASKHRDSWHFFEAAKVLGDLALALGDQEGALKFYGSLRQAPTVNAKIEQVYLTGMVHLHSGDADAAITEFDKVLGLKVDSVEAARLQSLSTAGKAAALASKKQADEGLKLVSTLIREMNPTDVEMAARTYNAQGAIYEAKGDTEGAIMAYLHTHLMFSGQSDAHAVALSKLVELWPKVGKPERGAEARQELQQRYPGFGK